MVRVLAVADEVAPQVDDVRVRSLRPDLVLAAGDLPWDYLEFLASCLEVPVVFVPGNHDPEIAARSAWGGPVFDGARPHGAVNADVRVVEAAGLRIAGLGGSVRYNRGPHQYTQREYVRRARRLARRARRAGGVDILLSHAPPRGLGDEDDGPHVGVESMHDLLADLEPRWHVHGHIHPHGFPRADRQVGPTTITNVVPWRLLEV
ncbi:MAG: metallophosphoesterase [Aeromicrobium sp.]|uniref:metallophosphoesterase family protein n=1 Tax=Aeromicrobium sp. TaxID=1871063 RepID=UPI0025C3AC88|nr:metallophosphoesterase [Aeromicrobium sp.]MCK5890222.1 metallophosphoesterase [Aeromicrobium sp.]MDF1703732.1 metallophosphoesterase [Aeromicrobium sp.]